MQCLKSALPGPQAQGCVQALSPCTPRGRMFVCRRSRNPHNCSRAPLRCQVRETIRPAKGRAGAAISCGLNVPAPRICQFGHDFMQAGDAGSDGNGSAAGATATPAALEPGLLLPAGGPGAWDEAGLGHPVVRYYLGDDEQRWFMWYSGRSAGCKDLDDVFPSSGSIGAQPAVVCSDACKRLFAMIVGGRLELVAMPSAWCCCTAIQTRLFPCGCRQGCGRHGCLRPGRARTHRSANSALGPQSSRCRPGRLLRRHQLAARRGAHRGGAWPPPRAGRGAGAGAQRRLVVV